jgi:hypothetical protein
MLRLKNKNPQRSAHVPAQPWHELGFVRDLSRNNEYGYWFV